MRRVIRRSIRRRGDGASLVGEVQGVLAANVGRAGTREAASKRSRVRVVQRGDDVEITEEEDGDDPAERRVGGK